MLGDGGGERGLVLGGPPFPATLDLLTSNRREYRRRLLAAHDGDATGRPHPEKTRGESSPAHRIVARTKRSADHHGELRYSSRGHRGHHLGAVLGDAAGLRIRADDETGDVLQEHERNAALVAQLDEVSAFERRLAEQHTVVRNDADRMPVQVSETGHERRAVLLLELVEFAPVDEARNDFAHVIRCLHVARHDAVQLVLVDKRGAAFDDFPGWRTRWRKSRNDVAHDAKGVPVIVSEVIGDTGDARMELPTAELLSRHDLTDRCLHERRTAEENRALVAHDHGLVAHRRNVRTTGGARPKDSGNLRNCRRRHPGLVEENPTEVIAVGKYLVLLGQERATGVHEVDARQPVLDGDLLSAQVFLHRERKVGSTLDRRVIRDDEHGSAVDEADARDDSGPRRFVVVEAVGRKR